MSKQILDRPFQQIAADFASYGGKQFLILVDCKTDWPDIIEVGKDTTRAKLTTTLRDYSCRTAALTCCGLMEARNSPLINSLTSGRPGV